jgi:osmotically-inducible protein OsmY
MSFLSKIFGGNNGYNDSKLVELAEKALEDDPMIKDYTLVTTTSKDGVVLLEGIVHSAQEQTRIENAVRNTLTNSGIKFERIENKVTYHNLNR